MAECFVSKLSDFNEGEKKFIEADGKRIGVYRRNGKFYAYNNICKHQGGPVCEGIVLGKVEAVIADDKTLVEEVYSDQKIHIVCPWHGFEYDLETGANVADKNVKLDSYEVVIKGDACYVIV